MKTASASVSGRKKRRDRREETSRRGPHHRNNGPGRCPGRPGRQCDRCRAGTRRVRGLQPVRSGGDDLSQFLPAGGARRRSAAGDRRPTAPGVRGSPAAGGVRAATQAGVYYAAPPRGYRPAPVYYAPKRVPPAHYKKISPHWKKQYRRMSTRGGSGRPKPPSARGRPGDGPGAPSAPPRGPLCLLPVHRATWYPRLTPTRAAIESPISHCRPRPVPLPATASAR